MNVDGAVPEFTVMQFINHFSGMVSRNRLLQRLAVVGEVTSVKRSYGNLSMTLKEGESVLSCFSFASEIRDFPDVRVGSMVRAEGSIALYPKGSLFQLRPTRVSLVGEGKLAAEIEKLRARLRAEGAFDASRKRDVPNFPRRVALVTSDDDARADFEGRMAADAPHVKIAFFATRVQGKGAEIEIAEAMDRAARARVDVIVLTRGGGSSDDLLTFNLEPVVRAILRSPYPVVTALGHLKNRHLADDVADLAVATPTAAAVHLSREWLRAAESLRRLRDALLRSYRFVLGNKIQELRDSDVALAHGGRNVVSRRFDRVRELERRLDRRSPAARVADWRVRLVRAQDALQNSAERAKERWRRRLERAEAALSAEDPTRPLARGFAIITKDGVAIRDAKTLVPGDTVAARLERGTFGARVESVHPQ